MAPETNRIDPTERTPVEGAKDRTQAHLWLQKAVGEWTYTSEMSMPDGSAATTTGKESVRKVGEYWVVMTNTGIMPDDDQPFEMVISVGYDIGKKKFVGSWIGSMMRSMSVYEGEMDESGALNLYSEGESFEDETKTATYRDQIRWEGDTRVFTSSAKGPDGEWFPFNTVRYTRAS